MNNLEIINLDKLEVFDRTKIINFKDEASVENLADFIPEENIINKVNAHL